MRSIGIQPDIVLCRAQQPLPADARRKISLFTNVEESSVISAEDVSNIYSIPRRYHEQGLDSTVVKHLGLTHHDIDLNEWYNVVSAMDTPETTVTIGMVGKYVSLTESYKSLSEALVHAGIANRVRIDVKYFDAETLEISADAKKNLAGVDGILVPGGFGERGTEGMINAVEYARSAAVPYLGICLGLQIAVIEYARNVAGMNHANSTEFDPTTPFPVVALVTEWTKSDGDTVERGGGGDLGGTMRLGAQRALLKEESKCAHIYDATDIYERHRHRYEVNNTFLSQLEDKGLSVSGKSIDDLVEMVEVPSHPWFVACQFHPEFKSTPRDGHPLFSAFVAAAGERKNGD